MGRRGYPPEFRRKVLDLVEAGRSVADLAHDLGIGRAGKPLSRKADRAPRSDPYTEHRTQEGKVYCAVVLDAYSRRVVGWSIDSSPTSALVTNALGMAIDNRQPTAGGIIHSDQGVQFASWAVTQRARDSGLHAGMDFVAWDVHVKRNGAARRGLDNLQAAALSSEPRQATERTAPASSDHPVGNSSGTFGATRSLSAQ